MAIVTDTFRQVGDQLRKLPKAISTLRNLWLFLLRHKKPLDLLYLIFWNFKLNRTSVSALEPEELKGWLPLQINTEKQTVAWVDRGQAAFNEPFFYETIGRIIGEHNPPPILTKIDTLKAIRGGLKPTGFIFHTSKCGSTLVSNMFKALPRHLVISEPNATNSILTLPSDQFPESVKIELFQGAVNAFAQSALPQEKKYFIKFTSWNVLQLPFIKKAFPDVPWLFLYRHPVEIIVSLLQTPTGWLSNKKDSHFAKQLLGADVSDIEINQMSDAEYSARVLANFCQTALQEMDAKALVVNYNQLSEPCLRDMLTFFQIEASEDEIATMAQALNYYSKDAIQNKAFQDDSAAKQKQASAEIHHLSEKWAMAPYRKLENQE